MRAVFDRQLIWSTIDVLLVAYIIFRGLLIIRGTRAAAMLTGLTILGVLYLIAEPLQLVTLSWLLGNFLGYLIIVLVVLFQDEIRRGLITVGAGSFFGRGKTMLERSVDEISLACGKLSKDRLGALIVIQRDVGLDEFLEGGSIIDSTINKALMLSMFLKESPLHDGAAIIVGDRLRAAGCVLPLSFNPDLDPNLGTRHRAALGLSERSDAIVLVVSEETGAISLVREGRMIRNLDSAMLRDALIRLLTNEGEDEETEVK
jgi:diadenylate cyclase